MLHCSQPNAIKWSIAGIYIHLCLVLVRQTTACTHCYASPTPMDIFFCTAKMFPFFIWQITLFFQAYAEFLMCRCIVCSHMRFTVVLDVMRDPRERGIVRRGRSFIVAATVTPSGTDTGSMTYTPSTTRSSSGSATRSHTCSRSRSCTSTGVSFRACWSSHSHCDGLSVSAMPFRSDPSAAC